MILPEQTAIQCFPRPQAGFGLRWGAGFLSVPSCCPPVRRHHFLRARHWRWADRRRSAPVFFSLRASGLAGRSCLLRDSSCRGLRFSRRGGLRRGLCRDGIIRFRLPGRLRGWLGTCLRPVQCKGSGKHHGSHHNGQDYFFLHCCFPFYIWGRCGISLPRCNAVRRWSGHPARGAGSAAAAGFHPPLPAPGPYRHS